MQAAKYNEAPGGQIRLHDKEVWESSDLQALTEKVRRFKTEMEGERRLQGNTASPDGTEEAWLLQAVTDVDIQAGTEARRLQSVIKRELVSPDWDWIGCFRLGRRKLGTRQLQSETGGLGRSWLRWRQCSFSRPGLRKFGSFRL